MHCYVFDVLQNSKSQMLHIYLLNKMKIVTKVCMYGENGFYSYNKFAACLAHVQSNMLLKRFPLNNLSKYSSW